MKVALVITVKNEERILRTNLIYHLAIGVEKIFVYFDGTTDNGRETISDLEHVACFNSVDGKTYSDLKYLEKFNSQFHENHTARQCINTFDAKQKCLKLGIDWLLSLDADELFLMHLSKSITLSEFFNSHKNFDIIQLKPLEAIGRKLVYNDVMKEEDMFKLKPHFKHWNDKISFNYYDPYQDKLFKQPAWFGHTMGKCVFKVNSNIIPKNVHRYKASDNSKPNILNAGYVLHYYQYDYIDFIKKYRNFKQLPDTFLSGKPIPNMTKLWRRLVNDPQFDELYLKEYYRKYIFNDQIKLKQLSSTRFFNIFKRKEKAIIKITYAKDILKESLKEESVNTIK